MKNYEELIEFCNNNMSKMTFSNKNYNFLLENCANYLLNDKFHKWNNQDSIFIVNYLNKHFFEHYKVKNFEVNFLNQEEMDREFGKGNYANCAHAWYENQLHFKMNYGMKIINLLTSNDNVLFVFALHSIYHELAHVYQQLLIHSDEMFESYTSKQYLLAIEDIILRNLLNNENSNNYKEFYRKNYLNLYHEIDAENRGLDYIMKFLKNYNEKILEEEDIKKYINEIEEDFRRKDHLRILKSKSNSVILQLLVYEKETVEDLISEHKYILEQYPILNVAFDKNGIKKDELTLTKEKKGKINLTNSDSNQINELYDCIININKLKENPPK